MGMRRPVVAGKFYSGNKDELRETVERYITASGVDAAPDRVCAIVAPHAGYDFSGPTAGYAYARVRGKRPKRVILFGGSHHYRFDGASVFASGGFEIPSGSFPIDEPFARRLAQETGSESERPHAPEHSIEVQLPFLWAALGETPIVPVLLNPEAHDDHAAIGRRVAELVDESDLVVASTDLSHYLPEREANRIDKRTIDTILSQDCAALINELERHTCSMCGGAAVTAAMAFALARGAREWSLLDYRTSGAAFGDYSQVVGYAAISMEREG